MARVLTILAVAAGLFTGAAVAGTAVADAAGAHKAPLHRAHAPGCAALRPSALAFTRQNGRAFGILTWRPGTGAPRAAHYRVLRNGHVVGQTNATSMRVNVSIGHRYTLRVLLVESNGTPMGCAQSATRVTVAYRRPGAPRFAAARSATSKSVTITWQRSLAGDGGVIGYRVLRNGAVYGQTKRTSMVVAIASNRTYTFRVVAVDRNDRLSRPSVAVTIHTGHEAPAIPGGLSAIAVGSTGVALSWQPSQAVTGRIAGYRVLRNGAPVGQFTTTSVRLGNLTPSTTYRYSVEAVDSLGYVSPESAIVSVRTGAPTPPSTPASLLAAPLNDRTVALSWQPSQPAQGRIAGYRVLRNGTPVGQYSSTSVNITNLAPSTSYTFTVVAVDSLGNLSDPSTPATVVTANPTPTSGHVFAFLLADTGQSFTDFQAHYQEIGTVSPTYYDCDTSTHMTGANVPLITQWAQAREVAVLPRFNCQRSFVLDEIVNNPGIRQYWLDSIMNQVNANGYDGVTLDFEAGYAQDRDAFTSFVTTLAGLLHSEGKTLMLAVSPKTADVPNHPRSTFFDYNALSAQADEIFVMAWGIHYATSAPGAQDDMTWQSQVIKYVASLPRVNKYILGMQLYAMDWANGGGLAHPASSYEYAGAMALAQSVGATPTRDPKADALTFSYTDASGNPHTVWFTNASTEGDRIALAQTNGFGGVGVWRLGEEDQQLWANPLLSGTW
jgi:spore germination protein YaaH